MNQPKQHPYRWARIALGTKHKKERVIRPQFLMQLGATLIIPERMDTDKLGTFTGEIEREASPYDTVFKKAEWAMELTGLPLGLASEGSFGPHPDIGLIPANSEWMVFIDRERELSITERSITTKTNFGHIVVPGIAGAEDFLTASLFPSHGVIVRPHSMVQNGKFLFKGIVSAPELKSAIEVCAKQSEDGMAQIETDMRAHMNPSRQYAIQMLAQKLARRLRQLCPSCGAPGWGLLETIPGLPCETCESPTSMADQERIGCSVCDAFELKNRSDGLKLSPAQYCQRCNP